MTDETPTSWWTAGALRRAIGASWVLPDVPDPGARDAVSATFDAIPLRGASIDSRETGPGQVFFALGGERTDGHKHIADAIDAGAILAVIADRERVPESSRARCPMLLAPPATDLDGDESDPVASALARAGNTYRAEKLRKAVVVGVTGSNGKTTTVRMLVAILKAGGRAVGVSRRSFNTRLGLAVTLLNSDPASDVVVCEVGTSRPGEIAYLGAILEPDVGVVTSVGHAHLEALGSTHGVAVEKSALLASVVAGGVAVINGATRHADVLLGAVPAHATRVVTGPGGTTGCDLRFAVREPDSDDPDEDDRGVNGLDIDLAPDGDEPVRVGLNMIGAHNAANACIAAATAMSLPRAKAVGMDAVGAGLGAVEAPPMRLTRQEIGGVLLINDAYNANPDSMLASLMTFDALAGDRRRVLVLGDMREMGEAERPAHEELGIVARRTRPAVAVWVGSASQHAARAMLEPDAHNADTGDAGPGDDPEVHWQPELDADAIVAMIRPGDAVLLKGSRSLGLERVEQALRSALESAGVATAERE